MTIHQTRRALLATGAGLLAAPLAAPRLARSQTALTRLKFTLDWALQGPNSYALLGREKGFFRAEGIDVAISRGFGSGRVPVDIAGGTFEMGQADINPTLKFMAENPNAGLIVVAIAADRNGMCVTVRGDSAIMVPKDLEGKTLAAPQEDAGRQLFPVFASRAGFDAAKVNWQTVRGELREPMLVQRRADGITGAATSTGMSLKALGLDWPQQRIIWYRDYGLPLYGTCWLTTRDYARRNPALVRAVVAGGIRALRDAYRDPAASIAALKTAEPLTDVAIEAERQMVSFREQIASDHVTANGLSAVVPARFQQGLAAVEEAYGMAPKLKPEDVYSDAFLPPSADRRLTVTN
jgi:NitT/TauT family transport system substrate-binding protein